MAQFETRERGRLNRTINTLLNVRRGAWVVAGASTVLQAWMIIADQEDAMSVFMAISLLSLATALISSRLLGKHQAVRQDKTPHAGRLSSE